MHPQTEKLIVLIARSTPPLLLHHVKVRGCTNAIKLSTWNPSTALRERSQMTARLQSGVEHLSGFSLA